MNHFIVVGLTLVFSVVVCYSKLQANQREFCLGSGCLCKSSFNLYVDFTIDISSAFEYPVENIGDKETPAFYYVFSPCDPIPCRNGPDVKTAAVCQLNKNNNSTKFHAFNCGEVSKATWTIESRDKFTVVYGAGDDTFTGDYMRESMFTFHVNYTSSEPSKIEFLREEKALTPKRRLTYYFNVTLNKI